MENKEKLKKLADPIVSEECPASGGQEAKKEVSGTVKATNILDVLADILYLIEDSQAATMTPGPDDIYSYAYKHMDTIIQAIVDKAVLAKFESVNLEIPLRQTINDIVSSPRYVVKLSNALLETNEFLELVSYVIERETYRVMEVKSKREKRIKTFPRLAKRHYLSVRHRPESPRQRTSSITEPKKKRIRSRIPTKNSVKEERWNAEIAENGKTKIEKVEIRI